MRTLRLTLAGLLAGLGLVALTEAPAYACSCALAGPQQFLEYSDAAFTGTLTAIDEPPPTDDGTISSTDPVTYRFDVTRVLEGDVAAEAEVRSARFGASCGLEGMQVARTYVVFVSTGRQWLEADLCGGTRPARDPFVERVAELAGAGPDPISAPGPDLVARVVSAILAMFAWPS